MQHVILNKKPFSSAQEAGILPRPVQFPGIPSPTNECAAKNMEHMERPDSSSTLLAISHDIDHDNGVSIIEPRRDRVLFDDKGIA